MGTAQIPQADTLIKQLSVNSITWAMIVIGIALIVATVSSKNEKVKIMTCVIVIASIMYTSTILLSTALSNMEALIGG